MNAEYIAWRDKFIPIAEAIAYAEHPRPNKRNEEKVWSVKWDAAYHRAMTSLTSDPFTRARVLKGMGTSSAQGEERLAS